MYTSENEQKTQVLKTETPLQHLPPLRDVLATASLLCHKKRLC